MSSRKKRHPAKASRIATMGAGVAAMLGMMAAMAEADAAAWAVDDYGEEDDEFFVEAPQQSLGSGVFVAASVTTTTTSPEITTTTAGTVTQVVVDVAVPKKRSKSSGSR